MKIKIYATSNINQNDVNNQFNTMAGELGGICYMPNKLDDIIAQPEEKKFRRAENAMAGGHHSIFDHQYVTLYLEDIPKLFAMLLNNENVYTTSEKSGRYTNMLGPTVTETETKLYNKWMEILKKEIGEKYGSEPFFAGKRIDKLAQENARYFLSIYTPTSMAYTVSYRQLNYIYHWLQDLKNNDNELLRALAPTAKEFCENLERLNLINENLGNYVEHRDFSLIGKKVRKEYFGDIYSTNYTGSFAQYAQAQRHRSIYYEMMPLQEKSYYIPKIIENNPTLKDMWMEDMMKVANITPQGENVLIMERGTPEKLILKARERLCTCAQNEIANQTHDTIKKYIASTDDDAIRDMLLPYSKDARCTAGYKCNMPCAFKEGVDMSREI